MSNHIRVSERRMPQSATGRPAVPSDDEQACSPTCRGRARSARAPARSDGCADSRRPATAAPGERNARRPRNPAARTTARVASRRRPEAAQARKTLPASPPHGPGTAQSPAAHAQPRAGRSMGAATASACPRRASNARARGQRARAAARRRRARGVGRGDRRRARQGRSRPAASACSKTCSRACRSGPARDPDAPSREAADRGPWRICILTATPSFRIQVPEGGGPNAGRKSIRWGESVR